MRYWLRQHRTIRGRFLEGTLTCIFPATAHKVKGENHFDRHCYGAGKKGLTTSIWIRCFLLYRFYNAGKTRNMRDIYTGIEVQIYDYANIHVPVQGGEKYKLLKGLRHPGRIKYDFHQKVVIIDEMVVQIFSGLELKFPFYFHEIFSEYQKSINKIFVFQNSFQMFAYL